MTFGHWGGPIVHLEFLCSLYLNHMYTIQYWNESSMEWRGTGSGTFYDKSHGLHRMRSMSEMCDHCVRFRVVNTNEILTREEREFITCEEESW